MNLSGELIDKLHEYAYSGTLGAFAAIVGYLYQVARNPGSKVSFFLVLTTVVIGFYLGVVFGSFIPKSWDNRDAVLLLIGATGLKGFELVLSGAKSFIPTLLRAAIPPGGSPGPGPPNDEREGKEGS